MRLDFDAFAGAQGIGEKLEPTLTAFLGVEQLERTRGEVARIGGGFLALGDAVPVVPCEVGPRHVDLAARLEQLRRLGQLERHIRHGFQIVRHVIALLAVAAHGADFESAVDIGERHRHAVDLQFDHIAHWLVAEQLAHALVELAQIVGADRNCQSTASARGGGPWRIHRSAARRRAGSDCRA